jgi:hypothetical protein
MPGMAPGNPKKSLGNTLENTIFFDGKPGIHRTSGIKAT